LCPLSEHPLKCCFVFLFLGLCLEDTDELRNGLGGHAGRWDNSCQCSCEIVCCLDEGIRWRQGWHREIFVLEEN
jgi:hypothetical protein